MEKEKLYEMIQNYLKDPPIVVWGSGATIAYGLPSMKELNSKIISEFDYFDSNSTNLEEELGKEKYFSHIDEIRDFIWKIIYEKDKTIEKDIIDNSQKYEGITKLVNFFLEPHPNILNIITTNYDRVIENVLSINDIDFTDGFTGRAFSIFNDTLFNNKNKHVNLVKVHGSLNWFSINNDIRYYTELSYKPEIIPPGKNKYRQAFAEPYRNLIQISDELIKKSKSILVVGFGFNDEHITPLITDKIRKGEPIVIITYELTNSTKKQLLQAKNYIALERYGDDNKTKVSFKGKNDRTETTEIVNDNLWQLNNFMEVLYAE